jgi:hypothetical protein
MKLKMKIEKEFDVRFLKVTAGIRYAEDVNVNGEPCGDLKEIPLHDGEHWQVTIDVNTGVIENWPQGTTAGLYAKVCDDGVYSILDADRQEIKTINGYVLDCLAIGENGYGDYMIIEIDENGKIKNWKPKFPEFVRDDDDD